MKVFISHYGKCAMYTKEGVHIGSISHSILCALHTYMSGAPGDIVCTSLLVCYPHIFYSALILMCLAHLMGGDGTLH